MPREDEQKLPRHHYIPVFYLKQWRGTDGRLLDYTQPYNGIVKSQPKHPDGVGYVRGLYRLSGVPDEVAEIIEQTFFAKLDDQAAYAHKKLLKREINSLTPKMREAWTLFLLSILMRSPRAVADTYAKITADLPAQWEAAKEHWAIDFPNEGPLGDYTPDIARQYSLMQLRRFIANDAIGEVVYRMHWSTFDVSKTRYRFLTSDRPVVNNNGLGYVDSHIAIPLSPTMLFLGVNSKSTLETIQAMPDRDVVFNCNRQVVRRAVKYVWTQDHSNDALIKSQMSEDAKDDPSMFSGSGPIEGRELTPLAKQIGI